MHVARLGLTPVKGMAHVALPEVELTCGGPLHDRVFCVVEADTGQVLRTVENDTGEAPAFVEDTWVGSRLRIGAAVVTVEERLPRCAVVDRRPAAGGHDVAVLRALAADRRDGNEIGFGVSGEVERLAQVALAAPVRRLD